MKYNQKNKKKTPRGFGKLFSGRKTSKNTLELFVVHSQLEYINVSSISKSHIARTFCVSNAFLPRKAVCLGAGAQADICVLSIAPIQSYTCDINNASIQK